MGRVRGRRLTRREVERSLQDLLGIDIPLADQLPEEASATEFTTVADGQAMSHFQLERHLAVVDTALDEAFRRALTPDDRYERDFDARGVARRSDRQRTREPEMRDGQAVVWSSGLIFYGRLPATTAPENGWYRFNVRAAGLKPPASGGVWATVRTGLCVSSAPLLAWVGAFEAGPQAKEIEFEAWLPKGHMLEIRPGDATLKKARFAGGQVGSGEGEPQDVPGIALEGVRMERFHRGPDNDGVCRLLLGELELKSESKGRQFTPVSTAPREDAVRLLEHFARRAFRRPVATEDLSRYLNIMQAALEEGQDFTAALRAGYRAMLCSPRFLYLTEAPGRLDDHALAARLSYLLTGSTPDGQLTQQADAGWLRKPEVLRKETGRLLSGSGGRRFIEDFAAEWLDLDQIDFTEPDGKLYPDFDSIVQQTMLDETRTYLETMLREDLSVSHLIRSDFTFLNSRLARFYEIDGVAGDALRRVALEPRHHRGGVLTQGAILKVTWQLAHEACERCLTNISRMVLAPRMSGSMAGTLSGGGGIGWPSSRSETHTPRTTGEVFEPLAVKIDPPGFALENFDPAGRWRDRYIQLINGRRNPGAKVDASYALPDGRAFRDIDEFRSLIAEQPRTLARNVAEKLLVYGTGAPISFADRQVIDEIIEQAADNNYGFRSILEAVVSSRVFLSK